MARKQRSTEVGTRKRKSVPGASDVMKECARRFRERTGRDFSADDRAVFAGEVAQQQRDQRAADALRKLQSALKEMETADAPLTDVAAGIREVIAERCPTLFVLTKRAKVTPRGALLWAFDTPCFFGTSTPASPGDLAVVSFLCGAATAEDASTKGKTAASLIDRERANVVKLRAGHGLGLRTGAGDLFERYDRAIGSALS